jgi:hypothetical protein
LHGLLFAKITKMMKMPKMRNERHTGELLRIFGSIATADQAL